MKKTIEKVKSHSQHKASIVERGVRRMTCICGHGIKIHNTNGCNHYPSIWDFCVCGLTPIEIRKTYFASKRNNMG